MTPARMVEASDWESQARALHDEGSTFLDLLAGIDREQERELVLRVLDPRSGEAHTLTARVPAADPRISSLASIWPGARWQEREMAELLGVVFDGHPDPRPLLLRGSMDQPPLLKSTPLPERLATSWPGAAEAQERKRRRPQLPPGVRPEWMSDHEGER